MCKMDRDSLVTLIRNKGSTSSMECIENIKNASWIVKNFKNLSHGDHALISEYGPSEDLRIHSLNFIKASKP